MFSVSILCIDLYKQRCVLIGCLDSLGNPAHAPSVRLAPSGGKLTAYLHLRTNIRPFRFFLLLLFFSFVFLDTYINDFVLRRPFRLIHFFRSALSPPVARSEQQQLNHHVPGTTHPILLPYNPSDFSSSASAAP